MDLNTTWDQFTAILQTSVLAMAISPMNMKLILNALHTKAVQREKDEKKHEVKRFLFLRTLINPFV